MTETKLITSSFPTGILATTATILGSFVATNSVNAVRIDDYKNNSLGPNTVAIQLVNVPTKRKRSFSQRYKAIRMSSWYKSAYHGKTLGESVVIER